MLKKHIIVLLLICMCLFLNSCVSDWAYELPNDYVVVNNAYHSIDLAKITHRRKNGYSFDIVVESYINEFSYNEQYVAVKQFDPEKLNFENFELNDFSNPSYYLVDTVLTNVYGPFETREEFETACSDMNVGQLCEWISTRKNPNIINVEDRERFYVLTKII